MISNRNASLTGKFFPLVLCFSGIWMKWFLQPGHFGSAQGRWAMLGHRVVTCEWYSLGMASYQQQERAWMLNDTRTQQLAMSLTSLEEEKSPNCLSHCWVDGSITCDWTHSTFLDGYTMWTLRVLGPAGCVKSSWNSKVPCPGWGGGQT